MWIYLLFVSSFCLELYSFPWVGVILTFTLCFCKFFNNSTIFIRLCSHLLQKEDNPLHHLGSLLLQAEDGTWCTDKHLCLAIGHIMLKAAPLEQTFHCLLIRGQVMVRPCELRDHLIPGSGRQGICAILKLCFCFVLWGPKQIQALWLYYIFNFLTVFMNVRALKASGCW